MSRLRDFHAFLARPDVVGSFSSFQDGADASRYQWWESADGTGLSLPADRSRGGVSWVTPATDDLVVQLVGLGEFVSCNQTGKELRFIAKFSVSDSAQCDVYAGFFPRGSNLPAATDGIGLRSDDGDSLLDLFVRKDSSNGFSASAAGTLGTSLIEVAFEGRFDPVTAGQLSGTYFVDGAVVGGFSGLAASNVPTDELLSYGIAFKNGAAAATTYTLEYIGAAVER